MTRPELTCARPECGKRFPAPLRRDGTPRAQRGPKALIYCSQACNVLASNQKMLARRAALTHTRKATP